MTPSEHGRAAAEEIRRISPIVAFTLADLTAQIAQLKVERLLLAKLAADTPQFFNPLHAFAVQTLRDKILKEAQP